MQMMIPACGKNIIMLFLLKIEYMNQITAIKSYEVEIELMNIINICKESVRFADKQLQLVG